MKNIVAVEELELTKNRKTEEERKTGFLQNYR